MQIRKLSFGLCEQSPYIDICGWKNWHFLIFFISIQFGWFVLIHTQSIVVDICVTIWTTDTWKPDSSEIQGHFCVLNLNAKILICGGRLLSIYGDSEHQIRKDIRLANPLIIKDNNWRIVNKQSSLQGQHYMRLVRLSHNNNIKFLANGQAYQVNIRWGW